MKKNYAISSLEAAIVMIAFVVVAAVFAYSVLGSGFFATDKAQQTVQEGTKTAAASVYQEGGIYATLSEDTNKLDKLTFQLYVAEQGLDQDLTQMIITYTESDGNTPFDYRWSGVEASQGYFYSEGRELLRAGENVRIELADVNGPTWGGFFSIEIRPRQGSTLLIKRYISSGFSGGLII